MKTYKIECKGCWSHEIQVDPGPKSGLAALKEGLLREAFRSFQAKEPFALPALIIVVDQDDPKITRYAHGPRVLEELVRDLEKADPPPPKDFMDTITQFSESKKSG